MLFFVMIITVSGMAGSGKSTTAKLLAKKLGYKHYSAGDMQREIAEELKISIEELGRLEAKDEKYDHMVDNKFRELGRREDNFVADGWLLVHFIPHAIKIFLTIDVDEAVKRRMKQPRETEKYSGNEEAKALLMKRQEVNRERWLRYYGFDYTDKSNYDLIVDTTNIPPEKVAEKILEFVRSR